MIGQNVLKGSKLTKSEYDCSTNEIKLKQELTKHFFYNNMPAKFS
jgi:regulatory protein YycI of two-component signal transduction system YycFG